MSFGVEQMSAKAREKMRESCQLAAKCLVMVGEHIRPGITTDSINQLVHAFIEESLRIAEQVQEEDREICEAVQRGLQSSHYDVGRYSVRRENGDHQFHQMLAQALRAGLSE